MNIFNKNYLLTSLLFLTLCVNPALGMDTPDGERHYLSQLFREGVGEPHRLAFRYLRNHLEINDPFVLEIEDVIQLQVLGFDAPSLQQLEAFDYLERENIDPSFSLVLATCYLFNEDPNNNPLQSDIFTVSEIIDYLDDIGCDYKNSQLIHLCMSVPYKYLLPANKRQMDALWTFANLYIFNKNPSLMDKVKGYNLKDDESYLVRLCETMVYIEDVLKLPLSPKLLRDCASIIHFKKEQPTLENLKVLSWCQLHNIDLTLAPSRQMLKVLNFLHSEKPNISDDPTETIRFGVFSQPPKVLLCNDDFMKEDEYIFYRDKEQIKKMEKQNDLEAQWFKSAFEAKRFFGVLSLESISACQTLQRLCMWLTKENYTLYQQALNLKEGFIPVKGGEKVPSPLDIAITALRINPKADHEFMGKVLAIHALGMDMKSIALSWKIVEQYDLLQRLSLTPTLNRLKALGYLESKYHQSWRREKVLQNIELYIEAIVDLGMLGIKSPTEKQIEERVNNALNQKN